MKGFKNAFFMPFVVVKMRAGLLQMIIRRDRMMKLGILVVRWKRCTYVHNLGSNTKPKKKSRKADCKVVGWWVGVNAYSQPDCKISVFLRLPLTTDHTGGAWKDGQTARTEGAGIHNSELITCSAQTSAVVFRVNHNLQLIFHGVSTCVSCGGSPR